VLRALASGLLAVAGVGLVYGVGWAIGLTWGLIAVAVGGGWFIGYALRRGATGSAARALAPLGALLGGLAWLVGGVSAFAFVQLTTGSGPLLDRLAPGKLLDHFAAALALDPQVLQPIVLATFVIVGWFSARPQRAQPPAAGAMI
jgi:hypothetical protein